MNEKGETAVTGCFSFILSWRPQRDLNSCCRRERPFRCVSRLILLDFFNTQKPLQAQKAVKKAVKKNLVRPHKKAQSPPESTRFKKWPSGKIPDRRLNAKKSCYRIRQNKAALFPPYSPPYSSIHASAFLKKKMGKRPPDFSRNSGKRVPFPPSRQGDDKTAMYADAQSWHCRHADMNRSNHHAWPHDRR